MKIHSLAVTAPWKVEHLVVMHMSSITYKTKSTTTGINISQTLVLGEGNFAVSSGERSLGMESAFIVDLESDDPDMQNCRLGQYQKKQNYFRDEISFLLISGKMAYSFYSMGTNNGKGFS